MEDDETVLEDDKEPPGVFALGVEEAEGVVEDALGLPRYISAILLSCSRKSRVRVWVQSERKKLPVH